MGLIITWLERILQMCYKPFNNYKKSFNFAFTLAEVLITLGIIGVVASMTIPTVMNNIQDRQFKSQLSKTYSVLSQLYSSIAGESGGVFSYAFTGCTADGTTGETCMKNALKTKLSYIKECDSGATLGICMPTVANIKYLNGSAADGWGVGNGTGGVAGLVLNDGTSLSMHLGSSTCSSAFAGGQLCGWITADVNGLTKPNTWGKDLYLFYIFSDRIVPDSAVIEGGDDCGVTPVAANLGHTCAGKYIMGN